MFQEAKIVYGPDWSIIIIDSKLNIVFFLNMGSESSDEVTFWIM